MIRQEISPSLTTALKILALVLRHSDPNSYGAYRIRRIRYNLLRGHGVKSHMTYPHMDKEFGNKKMNATGVFGFQYVRPIQIRHITRVSGAGSAKSGDLINGMRLCRG